MYPNHFSLLLQPCSPFSRISGGWFIGVFLGYIFVIGSCCKWWPGQAWHSPVQSHCWHAFTFLAKMDCNSDLDLTPGPDMCHPQWGDLEFPPGLNYWSILENCLSLATPYEKHPYQSRTCCKRETVEIDCRWLVKSPVSLFECPPNIITLPFFPSWQFMAQMTGKMHVQLLLTAQTIKTRPFDCFSRCVFYHNTGGASEVLIPANIKWRLSDSPGIASWCEHWPWKLQLTK